VRNKKLVAGLVPSLWAAAALVVTTALIAEIAATPTAAEGIASSTWTPITSITALFFGADSLHGSFNLPSVLFGLGVILLVSIVAGSLATAFITYCLGWAPPPAAAALLGAACGLAAEILLINLLCNWLQPDNGIYTSLPSWAWFPAFGAWGVCLGLSLSHKGQSASSAATTAAGGSGGGVPRRSPLLSGDPSPRPLPDPTK
jgi:hypothetical protein